MEFYQKSNQLHRVFFKDLLSVHYIFNTLMTYNVNGQISRSILQHFADDAEFTCPNKKLGTIESIINNKLKHL